jgi:hypothetical protein
MGVTYLKKVYAVYTTSDVVANVLKLGSSSKGKGLCIRYDATEANMRLIRKLGLKMELICSIEYLEAVAATMGKQTNRGDAFEKLVAEKHGIEWVSSGNATFDEAPDLIIDGIEYQVKYKGGTFTNETALANAEARAAARA